MAVQAVFPLAIPDEMLGSYGRRSSSTLPKEHANRVNDLLLRSLFSSDVARIQMVHVQVLKRLLGNGVHPEAWQVEYRSMFRRAYPNKSIDDVSIVDVGNAIAHFEELAFASADSSWDKYVSGQSNAIAESAKRGALVFYGKGRCAACHAGPLFSDFQYHGVGIFSKIYLNGNYVDDLGRGGVTHKTDDNYKFRTSPLRNVTRFGPYFHDGSTPGLRDAIVRHLNPLLKVGTYNPDGSFAIEKDQAESVSPILLSGIKLTDLELDSLVSFLKALDAQSRSRSEIVPDRVPSGIPIGN
jgi:cytochrome c peroxidase